MKIPENFLYYLSLHEGCNERLLARAGRFRAEEVEVLVLGNVSESWISFYREGRIWRDQDRGLAETVEKLKSALQCREDGSSVEGLWQAYYDSQYCPERKNLAEFRRRMPRRDQSAAGLRLVQNKKNATLESCEKGAGRTGLYYL